MKQPLLTDSVLCGSCSGRQRALGPCRVEASPPSSEYPQGPSTLLVPTGRTLTACSSGTLEQFLWPFRPPRKTGGRKTLSCLPPPHPVRTFTLATPGRILDSRVRVSYQQQTTRLGTVGRGQAQACQLPTVKEGRTVPATRSLPRGNDTRTTFVKYIPCKISTKF